MTEPAPSALVSSTREASSAFALIITYRLAAERTPPPRQHVMYGDAAPALVTYLDATIHLYPVIERILIQPIDPATARPFVHLEL